MNVKVTAVERTASDSSHDSDTYSYSDRKERRKPVEIQVSFGDLVISSSSSAARCWI